MAKNQVTSKALTEVEIDGRKAEDVLTELEQKAQSYRKAMVEAQKANDKIAFDKASKSAKEYDQAIKSVKKGTTDVNAVMKNLSGSTMNQLKAAQRQLTNEINKSTRGTAEYIAKSKQLQQVSTEINRVKRDMQGLNVTKQSSITKLNGWVSKWGGWALAGGAALTGISMGFKKLSEDANEYESKVANLSALTGLEGSSLDWLSEEAKKLSVGVTDDGVRITKSAGDIVDAFTLMGSAKPELLKNKEALALVTVEALKLAEAAKMDTKTAVESLANVMNQFGADASQANKYINVLAAGSKEGAAAVDSIAASVVKFGPAAAGANISIEQSVGLIETLAEKGLKGEIAGTQLKGVLLKLQTGVDKFNPKVVGLNKALTNLSDANLSAGDMVKMFGQESYTAGAILIKNKDQVDKYTKAVTGTNVATEQAVKNTQTMAAQLEQSRNKMKLASLELGQRLGGALVFSTNMVRKLITSLVDVDKAFVRWRRGLPQSFSDAAIKIKDEQTQVNHLVMQLTDANTKESERKKIIDELNKISPKLVEGLNAENLSVQQLSLNLRAYNEEAANRIILANLEADEQKELSKLAEAKQAKAEAQVRLLDVIMAANQEIAISEDTFQGKLSKTMAFLQKEVETQRLLGKLGGIRVTSAGTIVDYRTKEQKLLQNILDYNTSLNNQQEQLAKAEDKTAEYKNRIESLKEILGLNKSIAVESGTAPESTGGTVEVAKKTLADEMKILEDGIKAKKLLYLNNFNELIFTEQQYNDALYALEWKILYDKLKLLKKYGEDTTEVETQIAEKEKAAAFDAAKVAEDAFMKRMLASKKEAEEYAKNKNFEIDALKKSLDEKAAADQKYREQQIEKERQLQDELNSMRERAALDSIGVAINLAAGLVETQIEMSGQSEEEAEASRKRMIVMALDALQQLAIIAIGQIWAKEIASKSFAGIATAAILTGVVTVAVAAAKAQVNQNYEGRYDVTGAQDGKRYNVPYIGSPQTGLVMNPSLISERGPEIIIDAERSRNIRMRYPQLMDAIKAVPQHAAGTLGGTTPNSTVTQANDSELKNLLAQNNAVIAALQQQLQRGITADISYKHMKSKTEKAQSIEQRTNRKG